MSKKGGTGGNEKRSAKIVIKKLQNYLVSEKGGGNKKRSAKVVIKNYNLSNEQKRSTNF